MKGLLDWWKLWPAGGGGWVLTLGAMSTCSWQSVQIRFLPKSGQLTDLLCAGWKDDENFHQQKKKWLPISLERSKHIIVTHEHSAQNVLLRALFPQRTELLNLIKACSHHLLLGLVSDEPSTTFPLWKLDYNEKSEVTSNTTGPFDTSNPQRTYNTIPWSKTVPSKKRLVAVAYSWGSFAFAKFHSERNGKNSLRMVYFCTIICHNPPTN